METLRRIAETPSLRRVHLWLRALEKEDKTSIAILKRTAPGIERRVRKFIAEHASSAPDEVRRRDRLLYGWLQDKHFEEVGALDTVWCECRRCTENRLSALREKYEDEDDED